MARRAPMHRAPVGTRAARTKARTGGSATSKATSTGPANGTSPNAAIVTAKERAQEQARIEAAAVRAWLLEHQIRHVKVGGFDIDGVFRGKYIAMEKFLSALEGGIGFCDVVFGWDLGDVLYDNAKVTGWHSGYPDTHARIDPDSARVIPWEPDTAAFLLDFVTPDGAPLEVSPRQLLQKIGKRAQKMGYRPRFGAEFEFFIFRETAQSAREKGFRNLEHLTPGMFGYSWLRTSENSNLVHAVLDGCRAFGIPIEGMHTETGPGVYEVAILFDELNVAADRAALFKTAMKEICARHGVLASFMAKPDASLPGCSGHVHQSLWDLNGEKNLFSDPRDPDGLSKTLRHYVGGQIALMPELTALYWPTINSYKRSVENTWSPTTATWGLENRTCAIRVIRGGSKSTRIEYRQLAADMNPYIGMAVSLAAGLWGIEHEIEPPGHSKGNAYRSKARPLPRNLRDAVTLLKNSKTAKTLLGEEFVDHYVRTREWEVRQYEAAVTTWELERYLELI